MLIFYLDNLYAKERIKDVSWSKLIKREDIFEENESEPDYESGWSSAVNSIADINDYSEDDDDRIVNIEK